MNVFLLISGVTGIIVSILMLFTGAYEVWKQFEFFEYSWDSRVFSTAGIWQYNALPILSTISLFVFKHWIFVIPILFSIITMILLSTIAKNMRIQDLADNTLFVLFQKTYSFFGGVIIILGPPVFLTFGITTQKANVPTLLTWYFPLFVIITMFCAYISYIIIGMTIVNIAKILEFIIAKRDKKDVRF